MCNRQKFGVVRAALVPGCTAGVKVCADVLLVFSALSNPPLISLFPTVPSVAPANVSGGNGRRHELVILWEVSHRTNHLCRSRVTTHNHVESRTSLFPTSPIMIVICCTWSWSKHFGFCVLNFSSSNQVHGKNWDNLFNKSFINYIL